MTINVSMDSEIRIIETGVVYKVRDIRDLEVLRERLQEQISKASHMLGNVLTGVPEDDFAKFLRRFWALEAPRQN